MDVSMHILYLRMELPVRVLGERDGGHSPASSNLAKLFFPTLYYKNGKVFINKQDPNILEILARQGKLLIPMYQLNTMIPANLSQSFHLYSHRHPSLFSHQQPEWPFIKHVSDYATFLLKLRYDEYSPTSSSSLQIIPNDAT